MRAYNCVLVLGTGPTLWEDLTAACWVPRPRVIAVNAAGMLYPEKIDAWVSMHPENFPRWRRHRAALGHPGTFETYSRRRPDLVDHVLADWVGGSSGLYGVRIAFHLRAERVILCGIPMTVDRHVSGSVAWGDDEWAEAGRHRNAWLRKKDELEGRVKSYSGWTRELLGPPSPEWLVEGAD